MVQSILVPTDGSPNAHKAVMLAGDLAEKYGAKVILLHALLRGHLPEGILRAAEAEHIGTHLHKTGSNLAADSVGIIANLKTQKSTQVPVETLEFIGKMVLGGAVQALKDKGVTDITKIVEEGDPAQLILDNARLHKADMIVMGSRGLGDLKGLLVGSVSHKVSHHAECTCVSVR